MEEQDESFRFPVRFFTQEADKNNHLFENFSVWSYELKTREQTLLLNFPYENKPLAGTSDHIFPSPNVVTNLSEPFFHMAMLHPLNEVRIVYSLMLETKNEIVFQAPCLTEKSSIIKVTVREKSLIVLAIESCYLHPTVFRNILFFLFNRLPSANIQLEEELNIYLNPELEVTSTSIEFMSSDISCGAELGRFHQFLLLSLRPSIVLRLLLLLLADQQLLLTSLSSTQLTIACFALLSLPYPLQWPHVFITDLPENLFDTLGAPTPYLIGLPFVLSGAPEVRQACSEGFLNFDFGFLIDNQDISKSPPVLALFNATETALNNELDIYKATGVFPGFRVQLAFWRFLIAILSLTAQFTPDRFEFKKERTIKDFGMN